MQEHAPYGFDDRAASLRDVIVQFVSVAIGFVFLPEKWLAITDDGGASWRDL